MRGRSDLLRTGLLWALVLTGVARVSEAAPVVDRFDQGVSLTREGRFEEALEVFREVQIAGDSSGRLHFNLGVVYYRLQRLGEARGAFERAAQDPETLDLAHYNLGLVALAAGEDEAAADWFRLTATSARQSELRALAQAALERALGPREARRGSFATLRGIDSNVVVPVGAISDAPSSVEDRFWELRLGWADELDTVLGGLGYHLNGLMVQYDEIEAADVGLAQVGVDWRGPVTLDASAAVLAVDDSGYQRTLELRSLATLIATDDFGATFEVGATRLDALDARARDVEGHQYSAGLTLDGRISRLGWNLNGRRLFNDRESVALSPVQDVLALRLRLALGDWSLRTWGRYIDGDYQTDRRDESTEFGLGLSWSFSPDWDLVVEGSKQRNRSTEEGFAYTSDRLYGGLRLRF